MESGDFLKNPNSLVHKRVKVLWGKGRWYCGIAKSYDSVSRKHTIAYDDKEVKEYIMAQKRFEFCYDEEKGDYLFEWTPIFGEFLTSQSSDGNFHFFAFCRFDLRNSGKSYLPIDLIFE